MYGVASFFHTRTSIRYVRKGTAPLLVGGIGAVPPRYFPFPLPLSETLLAAAAEVVVKREVEVLDVVIVPPESDPASPSPMK